MVYQYELTFSDYIAAQKLHIRCNARVRFWFFVWQRIMPVVALSAAAVLLWDVVFRHFQLSPAVGGALGALVWLGLYPIVLRPYQLRRAFRQLRSDSTQSVHAVELELTDRELISRIPGRSEGRYKPGAILNFIEDELVALLYVREKMFLFIPKRALPNEGWAELRSWYGRATKC